MRTAVALLLLLIAAPAAAQSHLLIVSGLGGEPRYADAFHEWTVAMVDAARSRHAVPEANLTALAEKPERDPARLDGRATRENVLAALEAMARRAGPGDGVLILLIGHGSSDGEESRLNLPGPDLTARDLATALAAFPTQKVAVVNSASASGGFVEALSGKNRTIVTATQSPFERNETLFGRYFVDAYKGDGADADKDGKVSVLEAFDFARREVARQYKEENRILTEHALLDDNGDAQGSQEPEVRAGDGAMARTFFLVGGAASGAADASPELRALLEQQAQMEADVESLKLRKDAMPAAEYDRELERLLLELARVGQAVRELGGANEDEAGVPLLPYRVVAARGAGAHRRRL